MKIEGKEFMGRFTKGKVDEEQEYTIKYENGSLYKGKVKDFKAEGRGYLIDSTGTKFGEFKNGQFVREITESDESVQKEEETISSIEQKTEEVPSPSKK